MYWLIASLYWSSSLGVYSHTPYACHTNCYAKNTNGTKVILQEHFCMPYIPCLNNGKILRLTNYTLQQYFFVPYISCLKSCKIPRLANYTLQEHFFVPYIACLKKGKILINYTLQEHFFVPYIACFRNGKILKRTKHILHNFFPNISSLQAPLVHKWNGKMCGTKRRISIEIQSNTKSSCLCRMAYSRSLDKSFDGAKDMEMSQSKKRTSACLTIVEKGKIKNVTKRNSHLWLGFKAMNALNASRGLEEIPHKSVTELVKSGMSEKEALECQNCVTSYPFVAQEIWPSADDLGQQHFHHTQIPSDIEVCDGFAMDYHIALFFNLDEMIIPKEEALEKINKRMDEMKILLGDEISDPVAIMCTHGGKQWSGHAKIHLKNVQEDGRNLLQGLRPFIIRLSDNKMHKAKVCKSYDTIASSEMLSIKITSDTIKDENWYTVYEEVIMEGFKRGYNFEITHVRKLESHNYAWIVATSPEQVTNIRKNKITFGHECIDVSMGKPTGDDLAKKNALILIAKNLNRLKPKEILEAEIRACMGDKNILNIFFKNDAQGKLTGVCNIQCLSAAVYKKFVRKSHKICNKYVEFSPHPKSLDGISKPSSEELTRLGFNDVTTALADTVEAMENAPSNALGKKDINKIVEEAVAKGTAIGRDEMQVMEIRLTTQAKNFATYAAEKAAKALKKEMATLRQALSKTMAALESTDMLDKGDSSSDKDDLMAIN